jgi:hypothetical protein
MGPYGMEEFLEYKSLQFKQAPVAAGVAAVSDGAAVADGAAAGGKAPY